MSRVRQACKCVLERLAGWRPLKKEDRNEPRAVPSLFGASGGWYGIAGTGERVQAQEQAQGQVRQPAAPSADQTELFDISAQMQQLARNLRAEEQNLQAVAKRADDLLWYLKVSGLAQVDKIQLTSTKPIRMSNSTGQGAGNPLIGYTFTPKKLRADARAPLLVFVHGGLHSNFDTSYAHIVRELVGQGYILVAPDYRGSTGYGSSYYDQIDYGGAEIDDVHTMRDWAVANLPVDQNRVGIMGWSHGGYITLLKK